MPNSGHQASGLATKFPCSSYSEGLNNGMGRPDLASRSLRSPSAADLIPSATSASASRNSIEPLADPWLSSVARVFIVHLSRCNGVSHDRANVPQAGHGADGVSDGPRGRDVPHRAGLPDAGGHPGCTVQPDEICVATLPGRSGHGRIMRARSDKTSPDKYPISAQMRM